MPLAFDAGGRALRTDDLTLDQVLALESAMGTPLREVERSGVRAANECRLIIEALLVADGADPAAVRSLFVSSIVDDFRTVPDDLPTEFEDGVPCAGGRSFDAYVVAFARRQGWPPDVTRRQRVRDLDLLLASYDGDDA